MVESAHGLYLELTPPPPLSQGVESLKKVYQETPDFTDDKGTDDVTRQLFEVML